MLVLFVRFPDSALTDSNLKKIPVVKKNTVISILQFIIIFLEHIRSYIFFSLGAFTLSSAIEWQGKNDLVVEYVCMSSGWPHPSLSASDAPDTGVIIYLAWLLEMATATGHAIYQIECCIQRLSCVSSDMASNHRRSAGNNSREGE